MKKLLVFILCLALCMPALAMAEAAETTELYTIDFGTFTMDLAGDDYYEVADEMVSNELFAIIYPHYDPNATTFDNINIVWCEEDAAAEITLYGAEEYAKLVQDMAAPQFESMGIQMSNPQVLSAIMEDNIYVSITYSELDYTAAGVELVTPQYQMQVYFCFGEAGTYIFTFTAISMEQLEAISAYVDGVFFK